MKLITSLILSATLLCGQAITNCPPDKSHCYVLADAQPSVQPIATKPHHSHRKLYMMLAMAAVSAITSYEMYSHTHHSPIAPTLPNPPAPIKPDLFLITCGVCNGKAN